MVQAVDERSLREPEALCEAVRKSRIDHVLTILLHAKSLRPSFLAKLVLTTYSTDNIDSATFMILLRAFLAAGALGDECSAALRLAVERGSLDFIKLFISYGTNADWGHGRIVAEAVRNGRCDILRAVLASTAISHESASRAVEAIPARLPPATRADILSALLDAGARGPPIEKELVLAVQNHDSMLVDMLRSRGTSIDGSQEGGALIAAVLATQIPLLKRLLDGPVEQTSLLKALPYVRNAPKLPRLVMTRLLLEQQVKGDAVDAALRDAVCDSSEDRDETPIEVLIQAGGDPAFDDAEAIRHAIRRADVSLFSKLLGCPAGLSTGLVSSILANILAIPDKHARYVMMSLALQVRPKNRTCLLRCFRWSQPLHLTYP